MLPDDLRKICPYSAIHPEQQIVHEIQLEGLCTKYGPLLNREFASQLVELASEFDDRFPKFTILRHRTIKRRVSAKWVACLQWRDDGRELSGYHSNVSLQDYPAVEIVIDSTHENKTWPFPPIVTRLKFAREHLGFENDKPTCTYILVEGTRRAYFLLKSVTEGRIAEGSLHSVLEIERRTT